MKSKKQKNSSKIIFFFFFFFFFFFNFIFSKVLHIAFCNENTPQYVLEYLLDLVDTSIQNVDGNTCYHCATEREDLSIISETLVKYNADLNVKNEANITPMHYLCSNESLTLEIVNKIFELHIFSNLVDTSKRNFLHYACKNEKITPDILRALIEKRVDINFKDKDGISPFHLIAQNKNATKEILQIFLEYKCDPNTKDSQNNTVLHYLCKGNSSDELIELLVLNKADVNQENNKKEFPMYLCCYKNVSQNTLKLLFSKNTDKLRIMDIVCKKGKFENLNYFLDLYKEFSFHKLVLPFVCSNPDISSDTLFNVLKLGGSPNSEGALNKTALHFICENKNINNEILELLLSSKCDPFKKDIYNNTPLHYLCKNVNINEELLDIYLNYFKPVSESLNNEKKSAFHLLCSNPSISLPILKTFKKYFIPNIPDSEILFPIHYLLQNVNATCEMVELLLENHTLNVKHPQFFLHYACRSEIKPLERLLKLFFHCEYCKEIYPDKDGNFPLHYLSLNQNVTLKCFKLVNGSLNEKGKNNETPFHILCKNKNLNFSFIQYFISEKADVDQRDYSHQNVLHKYFNSSNVNFQTAKLLVTNSRLLDSFDNLKQAPLHTLLSNKNASKIELKKIFPLFKEHIKKEKHLNFPTFYFICNSFNVSTSLLRKVLTETIPHKSLHQLCYNDNVTPKMIELLLKKGFDINLRDEKGNAPLHTICNNYFFIFYFLFYYYLLIFFFFLFFIFIQNFERYES